MANRNMPSTWSDLSDIKEEGGIWALQVRVVRAYRVPHYGNRPETLEVLFHDQHGTRMHAQINEELIPKYQGVIKEGSTYKLRNFVVHKNYQSYKTCNHQFIMEFVEATICIEISSVGFPELTYNFKSFTAMQDVTNINEGLLIDVIDRIVACSEEKIRNVQKEPTKLFDLTLEDYNGNQMECTVWGEYVEQVKEYLSRGVAEHVVILLQLCRERLYNGHSVIATAFNATKIMDGNSDEVSDFRSRLHVEAKSASSVSLISLTPKGPNGIGATENVRNGNVEITSIKDLLAWKEEHTIDFHEEKFWILAKIVKIQNQRHWFYFGCVTCGRKVVKEDARFRCTGCNELGAEGAYRFKIIVQIMDDSAYVPVTIWDKEGVELLGKTTLELRDKMAKETGNPDTFPRADIQPIVDKKALFNIKMKSLADDPMYGGVRTLGIYSIITDPDVVRLYEKPKIKDEVEDWWNDVQVLNAIEMVGSNDASNATSSGKRRKIDGVEVLDPIRRDLGEEFASSSNAEFLKEVKIEK